MDNRFRCGGHVNHLTTAPALPEGWHKAGPGLWRHENGEESRINPSSLFTNTNFGALRSAEGGGDGRAAGIAVGAGAIAPGMGASAANSSCSHPPVEQASATGYAPAPQERGCMVDDMLRCQVIWSEGRGGVGSLGPKKSGRPSQLARGHFSVIDPRLRLYRFTFFTEVDLGRSAKPCSSTALLLRWAGRGVHAHVLSG